MTGAQSHTAITPADSPALGYRLFSLALLLTAAFHFALLRAFFNREFPLATLQALIDGAAYKPFQFRLLIPWLVGKLHALTGAEITPLYQVVDTVAIVGVVLATRYLLAPYLSGKKLDVVSFAVLLLLPWNYLLPQEIALYIPSDMPAVAFFTLLLALGLRGQWRWYYPLFAIATLNRETTCFVTLALLFALWRSTPRKTLALHLAAQFLIWTSLKAALFVAFADNPGGLFEIYGISATRRSHFDANLEFLTTPLRLLILLSSFGYLWISAALFRDRIGDRRLRAALWSMVVFFGAMMVIGNLNETRIFGEFIPLVYTANVLIIKNWNDS
ncbi:MAG TPA: hypothetical protein VLB27_01170 [candidate division Zixibacteria bacterium]|nr:hypothetical protein [candidate division Zixibacteria bacterium]